MDNNDPALTFNNQNDGKTLLKTQLNDVLVSQDLESYRLLIKSMAEELNVTVLECAAALAYLNKTSPVELNQINLTVEKANYNNSNQTAIEHQKRTEQTINNQLISAIRMVRYRLDIGLRHNATLDMIKNVLVEESGVDIKNIANVHIQDSYTLIELPDEMPQQIFHDLKTVEINGQRLDIRRVKARNKRRGNRKHRQVRPGTTAIVKEANQ